MRILIFYVTFARILILITMVLSAIIVGVITIIGLGIPIIVVSCSKDGLGDDWRDIFF